MKILIFLRKCSVNIVCKVTKLFIYYISSHKKINNALILFVYLQTQMPYAYDIHFPYKKTEQILNETGETMDAGRGFKK